MRAWGLLTGMGIAALGAAAAHAYVPPSAFIVRKVAETRRGFSGVIVRSTVIGHDGDRVTGERFRVVTSVDYTTRRLRSRAFDDEGREIYATERDLATGEGASPGSLLLFAAQVDVAAKGLRAAGVPIRSDQELLALPDEPARRRAELASIARFGKGPDLQVAWIVGSGASDPAQLWVDTTRLLPVRLITRRPSRWDLRFEDFRFTQEFPFPRAVAAFEGGSEPDDLAWREVVQEVLVGAPAREFRQELRPGFTEEGNRADSELRELILKYHQAAR